MYGSRSTAEDKGFGTFASPAPAVAPGNSPTLNALERWLMSPEQNISADLLTTKDNVIGYILYQNVKQDPDKDLLQYAPDM